MRHTALLLAFLAVLAVPAVLERGQGAARAASRSAVPEAAVRALEQGRYWRASRILRDYLAAAPDTSPASVLLTAQAEAGWGHWEGAEGLLARRPWLDAHAQGRGRELLGRSRLELGRWEAAARDLARYLEVAPDAGDRERGLVELRRARALAEAGNTAAAMEAYDRALGHLPQLEDWILLTAAGVAADAGDSAGVARRLEAAPADLVRARGWRLRVRALRQAGALAEAARVAERAAGELDGAAQRAAAWALTGDLRLEQADTAGAREAYRRAMAAAPGDAAGVAGARGISALPGVTAADQLQVGRIYLRHGNRQRGVAALGAYLEAGGGTPAERQELRFEVARALFEAGDYPAAERALLALAGEQGIPARVGAEALYLAGRAQYRRGQGEAGQRTLLSIARRFPGENAAAKGLYLVGDLSHDAGQTTRARELYRSAVETVPDLYESGLAMMRLGGMAFLDGDHREAVRLYEDYLRSFPDGRRAEQALYWAARAYQALGEEDAAREKLEALRARDPISWYGLRAADLLEDGFWGFPVEAEPAERQEAAERVARAMDRLDLLAALGRDDAVDHEIGRVRRAFADEDGFDYALAEALNERGHTLTAIRMGWEIREREGAWNPRLLRIVYPFPFRDMILAEARERELDPWLVAGLIRRESIFKADIRSPAGAVGLMQVMPPTGTSLARQAGVRPFREALLEQPDINLHLGTLYLRELMDRYDGRLVPVLAAYNAGPNRVTRWREFPEYAEEELFAERIPYAETRDYVKIVQAHARIYEALYGGAVAAPGE